MNFCSVEKTAQANHTSETLTMKSTLQLLILLATLTGCASSQLTYGQKEGLDAAVDAAIVVILGGVK
jgi:hypothetical protein